MSPSEYRKKYEKVEAYYGDFYNDTIGARLLHEFKDFKLADSDDVIDYLLETDALRYGYTAVCFRVNGGAALYNGEDFRDFANRLGNVQQEDVLYAKRGTIYDSTGKYI